MKKSGQQKPRKPLNPRKAVEADIANAAPGLRASQESGVSYTRWAKFEDAILAKLKDPEKCKGTIARRQAQIDDDAHEAELVAMHIRRRLQDSHLDPQTCCVFVCTAQIARWLHEATDNKIAINKVTPYLRALTIPQLRYSHKNGAPGWVWRGEQAPAKATAQVHDFAAVPLTGPGAR